MKLQNKRASSKKKIIIITIPLLIIIVACAYFYYNNASNGTNVNTENSFNTREPEQDNSSDDTPNTSGNDGNNPTVQPDEREPYTVITPPAIERPSDNASYPIENAEYKIVQDGNTTFTITLYPIEGPDYNAQIKNYKQDALSYLKNRYGSTDNLTIDWNPASAANL